MIKFDTKKNATDSSTELLITVDGEFIAPIKATTLSELKKDLKVAGFRPGKMPDNIAERNLGENYVQSHVMEAVVMRAYAKAVTDEKIQAIDAPQIELKKFVPYSELEFVAKVAVMPTISLDPKKLVIKEPAVTLAKNEIEDTLVHLQRQMAKRSASKDGAAEGDEVTVDFEGVRAGKPVEGAAAKNQVITLGDKKFIPGFEENLVGLKKGAKKEFEVTFPKDYGHQDLAGSKVTFKVEVHEVNRIELPKIDDEFATSVGAFKNLAELKSDIEKNLKASKQDQIKKEYEQLVLDNAIDKINFNVPLGLVDQQIDRLKQEVNNNLSSSGLSLEQYLKIQGKTQAEVDKEIKEEATKRVKIAILVRHIVDQNNLSVSDRELEENYLQMKAQYTDPQMKREMDHEHFRDDLKNHLLTTKAIEVLLQYAKGDKK